MVQSQALVPGSPEAGPGLAGASAAERRRRWERWSLDQLSGWPQRGSRSKSQWLKCPELLCPCSFGEGTLLHGAVG